MEKCSKCGQDGVRIDHPTYDVIKYACLECDWVWGYTAAALAVEGYAPATPAPTELPHPSPARETHSSPGLARILPIEQQGA